MRSFAALSVVLLALRVSAINSVPLTKITLNGTSGVTLAGRPHRAFLKSHTANGPTTVSATNQVTFYSTSVGIGSPPTYYNLFVDTGSSNTWCGTNGTYKRTSTSIPTGESLNITYGSGNITGLEYLDQVTLAPNLVITNQSIGDMLSLASGLQGLDGIIGLGPVDLTNHTLSPDENATIPTVMNSLLSQGLIEHQILGVYFDPYPGNESNTNGALTYGGTDTSLYQGEVTYIPVTNTFPSSLYWGINVTSAAYGNHTIIPHSAAGIVDTGTTQLMLAESPFETYINAIPGATFNSTIGLIQIPSSSIPSMHPLEFKIADKVLILDVAAQLFPQDQNMVIGGAPGQQYGVVGTVNGLVAGKGMDFILGMAFVERYYVVFDTDNRRVGFAQT